MEAETANPDFDSITRPYKHSVFLFSMWQLLSTLALYGMTCFVMYLFVDTHYWFSLVLALLASGLTVRIFIIQHDCGHGCFFKNKKLNDIVGPMLSGITMTPYAQWAKEHNQHHATAGDLSRRGVGDVTTLTVKEYKDSPFLQKMMYRLYRNPFFLFTLGAFGHFMLKQRLPFYKVKRLSSWKSVMFTNLYMLGVIVLFSNLIGIATFMKLYLPIAFMAAAIGTWIFYVQHQFENTYWERSEDWSYNDAAMKGSLYYDLPWILHWFSGNIGYHHIHHLSSKIPNYFLAKCHHENSELQRNVNKLTLWQSRK